MNKRPTVRQFHPQWIIVREKTTTQVTTGRKEDTYFAGTATTKLLLGKPWERTLMWCIPPPRRRIRSVHLQGSPELGCSAPNACDFGTCVKRSMRFHMEGHQRKSTYQCRLCSFSGEKYRQLVRHLNRDHSKTRTEPSEVENQLYLFIWTLDFPLFFLLFIRLKMMILAMFRMWKKLNLALRKKSIISSPTGCERNSNSVLIATMNVSLGRV